MLEENRALALEIGNIISSKKGNDIKILDVHAMTSFADFFVIAHGGSTRQVKALSDEIDYQLSEKGIFPKHKEGTATNNWILIDYGDIIVHLFTEEDRKAYNLENLWSDAEVLEID